MTFSLSLLALAAVMSTAEVQGDSVVPAGVLARQDVSLELANRLLDGVMSICHAQGRSAVAAVVDRSGNLVALQRDDFVGPHNTLAAQRKAYTALSAKTMTSVLAERARNDPTSQNLNTLNELLLLGGGVPLIIGGEIIGALGVAGAGGSANDEGCAIAAVRQHLPAD